MAAGQRDTARCKATRVKICGLTRREDAEWASEVGADYLGVVLVPGSPRALAPREAREVLAGLSGTGVVVVADLGIEEAARAADGAGARVVQLHGEESPEVAEALRRLAGVSVWKALRVRGAGRLSEEVKPYLGAVDGVLLDAWHPTYRGGTGTPFAWEEARSVRSLLGDSALLVAAGGLHPGNVGEAIRELAPDVVDVSSGVEQEPGRKDPACVRAFVEAARKALNLEDGGRTGSRGEPPTPPLEETRSE